MELIANWFWQGGAVALVTSVLLRVVNRATARTRYLVGWAALLAVLALPLPSLLSSTASAAVDLDRPAAARAALVSLPVVWWTSNTLVLLGLGLWSAVQVLRFSFATSALQRARQRCRAFPHKLETRLSHWTSVKHAGRRARLMLSDHVGAAAVLGGWRPVIAVAPALLDRLSDDELDRVVIHEWAHVQRRDDFANAVQLAARVIAGWHPAVWWLDRRLRTEREAACDEMAIGVTGSTKAYAACLVKLAGLPRTGSVPALGMSSPSLTGRIETVLSRKPQTTPSSGSRRTVMAATVVVATVSIAAGSLDLVDRATILAPPDARPITPAMVSVSTQAAASAGAQAPVRARAADRPAPRNVSRARNAAPRPEVDTRAAVASNASHTVPALETIAQFERAFEPLAAPIHRDSTWEGATRPVPPAPPVASPSGSPWTAAAGAGTSIGRGSKKAGLATAGFFTRMGKGIADSFSSSSDARSSR